MKSRFANGLKRFRLSDKRYIQSERYILQKLWFLLILTVHLLLNAIIYDQLRQLNKGNAPNTSLFCMILMDMTPTVSI